MRASNSLSRALQRPLLKRLQRPQACRPQSTISTRPRTRRSTFFLGGVALLLGTMSGFLVRHTISPPAMPAPGTREDALLLADLNKQADEQFTVKVLRGKCLGVTKALKGKEGGWVEIVRPEGEEEGKAFVETLRGAKGLGVERVFWDKTDQRLVAVVYFGGALAGWPCVTHGGVIATALEEKLALANYLASGGDVAASNSAAPQRMPGTGNHAKLALGAVVGEEAKGFSVDYKRPTYANKFHVIRVRPSYLDVDGDVKMPIEGHGWVATLEVLNAESTVCAKATARFEQKEGSVVGKVEDGVKWSYQEFKDWMWPSRQKVSLG